MNCNCPNCCIDLETVVHLDHGDVRVSIQAKGIDDYKPDHHECTCAVRRAVDKNLVAPYREVMGDE